ncbi:MAG: hypothetical protein JWM14_1495 [Chitinophagaceae bacterium]|nr:hypothetical protein [Chitinophagaceae bacterium]
MIENDKLKLTTFIVGSIIFTAFIKQYTFYDYFSLDISDYIGLDEVLTPFIDDLSYNLIIMLITFCFFLHSKSEKEKNLSLEKTEEIPKKVEEKVVEHNWIIKVIRWILWNIEYVLFWSMTAFVIIYFYIEYEDIKLVAHTVSVIALYVAFLYILGMDFLSDTVKKYEKSIYPIFLIASILCFSQIKTAYDIYRKKYRDFKIYKYEFVLSDKKISTDKFNIYLGRTQNNFFIYNEKEQAVNVYNTSEIKTEKVIRIDLLPKPLKHMSKEYGIANLMLLDTSLKLKDSLRVNDKIFANTEHQVQIEEILKRWKVNYKLDPAPFDGIIVIIR